MAKFKVPEGCTSLSLEGENIEIIDGFIETDKQTGFLLEHGFELVFDETEPEIEEEIAPVEEPEVLADEPKKGKKA